jgi:uncharacterized protein (TIGR02611 family)
MTVMEPFVRHLIKILLAIVGFTLIGIGILLLVLPGPGWVMIFAGLGVLGIEFVWARKVLKETKKRVDDGFNWLKESKRFFQQSEDSKDEEPPTST